MPIPEEVRVRQLRETVYRSWRSRGSVSVAETSAILGYNPDTIRSMIASGKLATVNSGRNNKVTVLSIRRLLGEED